jgi:hypothetical protein
MSRRQIPTKGEIRNNELHLSENTLIMLTSVLTNVDSGLTLVDLS